MRIITVFLALLIATLWGISPVITKYLLKNYKRYTLMILFSAIYFLSLILCLPFYNKQFFNDLEKFTRKDMLIVLFQGTFILFFANVIYYYILKDNNTSMVIALESISPLITLILAYYLLNEKINVNGIIGIILIILGVICICYNDVEINMYDTMTNRD
jgi:drug/metabolite transporter (DMT)-like permease